MNITNITNTSDTVASGPATSEPWKESGAMVYVALTVATLSAVIMCCVWFIKQRINNDYGTVREDEEEEIELNRRSPSPDPNAFSDQKIEEDQNTPEPSSDAFTLEASDSDTSEREEEETPTGPFVDAHSQYTDNEAV